MVNKNNWEKALREESVLPDSWENRLNNFQKLILKTFLYSEEIITHIRTFVKSNKSSFLYDLKISFGGCLSLYILQCTLNKNAII